jgi:flagella basal body P-ring formation protein FlgA
MPDSLLRVLRSAGLALGFGALSLASVWAADGQSGDELIRDAVRARLGADAEVVVLSLDVPLRAGTAFRSARIDPAAWLGKPMRITLTPLSGPPVTAVANLRVSTSHVIARRPIVRGQTVGADDVTVLDGEVRGIPLRRLPQGIQVIGGRALRPVPAGAVLLPGAVTVRRTIEPGDRVTVVARAGSAEVSAVLVAADGGDPGDVIRVTNPETRRDLRGLVVGSGRVEVTYAR